MKKCGNTPGSPLAKVRFPYFGLIISTILAFTLTLDGDVAFAQAYTASLTGVVTDSSGAAIPNVSIMLRNMSTEEARTTTSGPDGRYSLVQLAPATYEIEASAKGFKTYDDDFAGARPWIGKFAQLHLAVAQEYEASHGPRLSTGGR